MNYQTAGNRTHLGELIGAQLVQKSTPVMETEVSIPYSRQPLTGPYTELRKIQPLSSYLLSLRCILILTSHLSLIPAPWHSSVVWRPGQVITMANPNRNHEL